MPIELGTNFTLSANITYSASSSDFLINNREFGESWQLYNIPQNIYAPVPDYLVPEPATFCLVGISILGIGWRRFAN